MIERRPPDQQPAERILDESLALGIQAARRLVENQYSRILEDRPGDRDSLPLSAGQLDPALTYDRVVELWQPLGKLVGMGGPRRGLHIGVRRTRAWRRRCSPEWTR